MSISPPSDIILDVARAADPARLRAAAARLDATAPADGAFEAALDSEDAAATASQTQSAAPAIAIVPPRNASIAAATLPPPPRIGPASPPALSSPSSPTSAPVTPPVPTAADKDFEAMVLSQLFQSMMPQDSTMFGEGTAGSVWSGLFVQEIGKAVAAKGSIGIAAALARDANLTGSAAGAAAMNSGGLDASALSSLADAQTAMTADANDALWGDQ